VPFAAACLAGNNLGGTRSLKTASAAKAVEITIVPAAHDSSVTRALLSEAERKNLEPDNLSLPLGPPSGYVIRFTNGLVMYLTGDTAVHADQKTVVADFHKPSVMVLNLGLSCDHDGVGRLHRERHREAGHGRDHASERGGDAGRQGAPGLAHRAALGAAQEPDRARRLGPHDRVRRAGQVRGRLLVRMLKRLSISR
jgi:hypothetical protein